MPGREPEAAVSWHVQCRSRGQCPAPTCQISRYAYLQNMSVTDDSDNEKVQDTGVWLLKSYWRSIVVDIKKKKKQPICFTKSQWLYDEDPWINWPKFTGLILLNLSHRFIDLTQGVGASLGSHLLRLELSTLLCNHLCIPTQDMCNK